MPTSPSCRPGSHWPRWRRLRNTSVGQPHPRPQLAASAWPRLRFADALAAAALLLIAGGLTIPLLAKLRQDRDRVACADNLRVLWGALSNYSEQVPDRSFPMIEEQGPRSVAAAFVPILHDAGMLPKTTLVACPARREQRKPANISLVGLSEAFGKGDEEFGTLARDLAGGYAYSLGYRNGDELVGLRASDPDTLPIIADLSEGSENSLNHGGSGQNVLYIGGNVRWCVKPTVGEEGDDIYVNRQFVLRAGESRSDTVLGPGDARPDGPSK